MWWRAIGTFRASMKLSHRGGVRSEKRSLTAAGAPPSIGGGYARALGLRPCRDTHTSRQSACWQPNHQQMLLKSTLQTPESHCPSLVNC